MTRLETLLIMVGNEAPLDLDYCDTVVACGLIRIVKISGQSGRITSWRSDEVVNHTPGRS
jgi:hypothetical protein